jgi:hypothetical protein
MPHEWARPVSEMGHILMCGDRPELQLAQSQTSLLKDCQYTNNRPTACSQMGF